MSSKRHETMAVCCKTMKQLGLLAGPPQSSPAVFKADYCLKFCAACAQLLALPRQGLYWSWSPWKVHVLKFLSSIFQD